MNQTYQKIIQADNEDLLKYVGKNSADLIYADMIFDNLNFRWIVKAWQALRPTGSLFIHTDQRSAADVKFYADEVFAKSGGWMNNWIIWPYDWGGRPRNAFGRKHDDILWYVATEDFKFYPTRVAIPKKTAGSATLNPSGRLLKIPTDVWSDVGNFLTTDPERIHDADGVCIPWQKPERLLDRIILATTDPGDLVVDPFLGTGTTAAVCKRLGRSVIGLDTDPVMVDIACNRIRQVKYGGDPTPKKKTKK